MSKIRLATLDPQLTVLPSPGPVEDEPAPRPRRSAPRALLGATRPRQWTKNLLVFAAPMTAGLLGRPEVILRTSIAALVFLSASAGTYLVNDLVDADADRVHPVKRDRPIASGDLSARVAIVSASLLFAAALATAGALAGAPFLAVVTFYVLVSVGYSLFMKRVPVIELACVSSGFVLRAAAGGAAVHIPISPWFVLVTSACALLVVTGKRSTELALLGRTGPKHRVVLEQYTASFLRSARVLAATVAVMSYALWAFERVAHLDFGHRDADELLFELSILPFLLGILTVELAIETGGAGAPEELVLRNRALQSLGVVCVALVAIGIYT